MPLSWNEIRARSLEFSREWADASSESADAKSFWDAFFRVFGLHRRRVAVFEKHVHAAGGDKGYVDLFWPGVLIAEHKSRGKNLDRAFGQAIDYFPGLKDEELPRYVIVSDFARFRVHDLDTGKDFSFSLDQLHANIQRLGFIAGYEQRVFREQDPVNARAAERLARIHDALHESGYTGHRLEVYLVRILFCLFAEDTGIFMPRGAFLEFIESCTREDGSDLGARLSELFDVLATPEQERLTARDERLLAFPYVNGKLFEEVLRIPAFDGRMRGLLIESCNLDWGQISPAIFGSLFQGILDAAVRRALGAHYTSEKNILKVIGPLFLDDLRAEFEHLKKRRSNDRESKLRAFHERLSQLQFFDPACGCGNFLVIAYRELRQLELELLQTLYRRDQQQLALNVVEQYVKVDVDQFHGLEIEEWPSQIARVAMWLMDHQMNVKVSQAFGDALVRIPLLKSANIVHANALQLDWGEVLPASRCSYLLGNPPFVGAKYMSPAQREDVKGVLEGVKNAGLLDYVASWYVKAARYQEHNPACLAAFVSTNSITQGEQVAVLWSWMLEQGVSIDFAHRTFAWSSEGRGRAAVHCVIVGFSMQERPTRRLFEYADPKGEPHEVQVREINPYLAAGPSIVLDNRRQPLCEVPPIGIGNKPIDGGNYLFSKEEMEAFIEREPGARRWFRRWVGSDEFIKGKQRWCLWLRDCPAHELRKMPQVMKRIEAVREFRLQSKSAPTQKLAQTPTRFHVENVPEGNFLIIPKVSSERRPYIPIGFMDSDTLCSDLVFIVPDATPYHLGVLSSTMHMAWVRAVCGRLESRYRYSAGIVYNNFPWPVDVSQRLRQRISAAAEAVLEARRAFPDASLADLYDPLTMPVELQRAHQALDAAVDSAYRERGGGRKWETEALRVGFLFDLHLSLSQAAPRGVEMG
ncbi:DNA methyltransferase [Thioalkalivibrio thiocyanodenitrificans]|uniref:DNA methyltransferase n=1 Tax=Thioalkalivibrio thiocyanodenitrificans TaxID=243063 RepID=UPI0003641577|nr:DNA methyltransferase [Thioalkalivibrio thiocyanodenitrificans]